jgi:hypothetical protein
MEQAFEWIVLEALYQSRKNDDGLALSIPGIQKAQEADRKGLHLNADRYLRIPGTFGFFGVYRSLAEYLGVVSLTSEDGPVVGPEGTRILEAWRADQGLAGFGTGRQGRGHDYYKALSSCLRDSFCEGVAVPNRAAYQFVQEYLHPGKIGGKKESETLKEVLAASGAGEEDEHRRQVMRVMAEPETMKVFAGEAVGKERQFHALLATQASPSLKAVLAGVEAYENFIFILHSSFDDLRRALRPERTLIPLSDLVKQKALAGGANQACSEAYARAYDALKGLGLASRLNAQFEAFSRAMPQESWWETLISHHERVQKNKPPAGKASWLEHQSGKIGVRPLYRMEKDPRAKEEYVYFYRTTPLFNFMQSLEVNRGQE